MQNTIIDCYDTRKNEMFVIIDSLFNKRIGYWIELLFVFRSRLSRVDSNPPMANGVNAIPPPPPPKGFPYSLGNGKSFHSKLIF